MMVKRIFDVLKPYIIKVSNIIMAFVCLCTLKYYQGIEVQGLYFTDIFLFSLVLYVLNKIKVNKLDMLFAVISSMIISVGKNIYDLHTIVFSFSLILNFLGTIPLTAILFNFLRNLVLKINWSESSRMTKIFSSKKTYFILALILVFIYGICYLSYFPGIYSYDIYEQLRQIEGVSLLRNNHPVFHTLLLKIFFSLGNIFKIKSLGIITYSLFQMIVVIATCVYLIYWMNKRKWNVWILVLTFLYFLLVPFFHTFSFVPTKDVLFSCFFLLLLVNLYDVLYSFANGKKSFIALFTFGLLSCLFRNNIIYIFLVLFLIIIFIKNKELLLSVGAVVVVYFFIMKVCFPVLEIGPTPVKEKLPIPITQMAYTYLNTDAYSLEDKQMIKNYIPDIESFNPRFVDPIKRRFNSDLYEMQKNDFWKLYVKGLVKEPFSYVISFLDLNIPYWYPSAVQPDRYSDRQYIEDRRYNSKGDSWRLKNINKFYVKFNDFQASWMKLPLLHNFFSLSFVFWSLLASLFICILKFRKENLLIIIILYLLFATYLLGPVSNFRYIYTFYLCLPFYLGTVFMPFMKHK